MVDVTKIKDEQAIFNESWKLLKKYYETEQKDEKSWDLLILEVDNLYEQFKGGQCEKFAKEIILSVVDHISRVSKNRSINEKNNM